ncbi:nuclear transport factor 2 family protein [Amycolatopsis sp. NPDC005232]|uniref:nuclear transport factor 2 family protein n=1 Tax=Amycolatopsis sp. NPDC005232 TaxID=3157027 RepID=UPI0033B8D31E
MSAAAGTRVVGREPELGAALARIACVDVINATMRFVDEKRATDTLALYTDDAVMQFGDKELDREALAESMRIRETDDVRRVHVPGQTDFWLEGPGKARAVTLLQLFNLGPDGSVVPPLQAITRLEDELVRSADGIWRIARRVVRPLAGA